MWCYAKNPPLIFRRHCGMRKKKWLPTLFEIIQRDLGYINHLNVSCKARKSHFPRRFSPFSLKYFSIPPRYPLVNSIMRTAEKQKSTVTSNLSDGFYFAFNIISNFRRNKSMFVDDIGVNDSLRTSKTDRISHLSGLLLMLDVSNSMKFWRLKIECDEEERF